MSEHIYADNAATTKLDPDAFEAMKPFLCDIYGNPSQPYSFSRGAKKAIKEARDTIAECINASPEEIIFTSGGTESNNWVIKEFSNNTSERYIITSLIEHHAILNACASVEKKGAFVKYLGVDSKGTIYEQDLRDQLSLLRNNQTTTPPILVSIMYANNEIGTIEPISRAAEIAHNYGAVFHTDAVQAIGHIPVDVAKDKIDYLSASAHKFNGPKGIGFLYKKRDLSISSHNDGGAQEFGLRAGTENVASIVAMAVALQKNCKDMRTNEMNIMKCEQAFMDRLGQSGLDYICNGSEKKLPGNISLSFRGEDGESLLHRLDLKRIYVSTGAACDNITTQISHVLKAIRLNEEYAMGTIRVSFGKDNTVDEAIKIADALRSIILNKNP